MIFNNIIFNKTPLFIAVENDNIDIINILLSNKNIDVNIPSVWDDFFDTISNYFFKCNSNFDNSIEFIIIILNYILFWIFNFILDCNIFYIIQWLF